MSPHLVFIAVPALGHVLPLLYLAHKAASSGILCTFIASDVPLTKLRDSGDLAALHHDNLRIAALPHEGSITWEDMSKGVGGAIMNLYHQMIAPTEQRLRALAKGHQLITDALSGRILPPAEPITRIVGSPFVFFGPPIAKELGIKWTTFMDTGVLGAVVTLQLAHRATLAEEKGDEDLFTDKEEGGEGQAIVLGDYMTVGEPNEVVKVFGEAKLTTKSPTIWLAKGFAALVAASDDLLVNTASLLDASALGLLQPVHTSIPVPVLAIGSVQSAAKDVTAQVDHLGDDLVSFLQEHKAGSVVYIAMGSGNTLPLDETVQLVQSLKASGIPFVWAGCALTESAAEADGGTTARAVLDEVVEQGQGLVLAWAKQRAVLASGAVGLFVSHAGWNSVLESLAEGIPMLLRPFGADHPLNARVVEEKYRAGRHFDVHTLTEDLQDFASGRGGWVEYQAGAVRARQILKDAWEEHGTSAKAWAAWTANL